MKVAGVVLAAGFSRRLGRPKQEIVLEGFTLLRRAVDTAKAAALDPLAAVVRGERLNGDIESQGAHLLVNPEAGEGMASSVRLGTMWAQEQGVDGVVIMACDQPQLRPEHLVALCADPGRITGSAYAGRIGVPAYFPSSAFQGLLRLQGDQGARALLQHAAAIADENLALDIDTEEDLRRAQEAFRR